MDWNSDNSPITQSKLTSNHLASELDESPYIESEYEFSSFYGGTEGQKITSKYTNNHLEWNKDNINKVIGEYHKFYFDTKLIGAVYEDLPRVQNDIGFIPRNWSKAIPITATYGKELYFPSMQKGSLDEPILDEYLAEFYVCVYVQTPDNKTTKETLINYQDVIAVSVDWGKNKPISFSVTLCNFSRYYTNPANSISQKLKKGIYSAELGQRHFLKIVFMAKCGSEIYYRIFPRLVIKQIEGTTEVTYSGVDEISEYLFRNVNFKSYCAEECLARVATAPLNTGRHFIANSLTITEARYGITKVFVNALDQENNYKLDKNTKILELTDTKWSQGVSDKFPVLIQNPYTAQWLINDIAKKVIDSQNTKVARDYFPIKCKFTDFNLYTEFNFQDAEPIKTIEEICQAVPAYWVIIPLDADRLSLEIRPMLLEEEYPENADFFLPESLTRGDIDVSDNDVDRINTVNVVKLIKVATYYEEVV